MRTVAFGIALLVILVATTDAYATKLAFDPSSGTVTKQLDYTVPTTLIAIALIAGVIVIILERKKAKGIWFSNSERLK